jgi:hypothetical protein
VPFPEIDEMLFLGGEGIHGNTLLGASLTGN